MSNSPNLTTTPRPPPHISWHASVKTFFGVSNFSISCTYLRNIRTWPFFNPTITFHTWTCTVPNRCNFNCVGICWTYWCCVYYNFTGQTASPSPTTTGPNCSIAVAAQDIIVMKCVSSRNMSHTWCTICIRRKRYVTSKIGVVYLCFRWDNPARRGLRRGVETSTARASPGDHEPILGRALALQDGAHCIKSE